MPFLSDDEFIILMNEYPVELPAYVPTLEDRRKYRKSGIQTAVEYPSWGVLEPEKGDYNLSEMERMLELNRSAGLKTIFSVYSPHTPRWIPDDWFAKYQNGEVERLVLSIWNEEAQEHILGVYQDIMDVFSAPDVLFILGEYHSGEAVLPVTPAYYDKSALENFEFFAGSGKLPDNLAEDVDTLLWLGRSVATHLVKRYRLFRRYHNEIWNMQQLLMNRWSRATGNYVQEKVLYACKDWGIHTVLLQYTFFDDAHGKWNEEYVCDLQDEIGCDVIVEAHFCTGLPETAPKSIEYGFRGQIISPTHMMTKYRKPEDWMFSAIADAHKLWKESRSEDSSVCENSKRRE